MLILKYYFAQLLFFKE